jgi:hypothetical protein
LAEVDEMQAGRHNKLSGGKIKRGWGEFLGVHAPAKGRDKLRIAGGAGGIILCWMISVIAKNRSVHAGVFLRRAVVVTSSGLSSVAS